MKLSKIRLALLKGVSERGNRARLRDLLPLTGQREMACRSALTRMCGHGHSSTKTTTEHFPSYSYRVRKYTPKFEESKALLRRTQNQGQGANTYYTYELTELGKKVLEEESE